MSPSEYPTSQPSSTTKKRFDDLDDDLLESLQNIPSNFDLALNGGTNRTFLSPEIHKTADSTQLLDPETFRRLSISTISSIGGHHSRNVSPYPIPSTQTPRTLQSRLANFWKGNQGLFLVSFSQLFGALMNVTTRLLELEGEGMHPLQVLFARMFLTMIFCCGWMRWKRVEDFPFGARGIRWLLVARGASGFFGIYGMYYSLQYLPVADAVVITFLAPSVASYGCYLFLKEPFPRSAQYASLISLLGVVLIARPTSFFSSPSSTTPPPVPTNSTTSQPIDATFPIPTSAQRASAVAVALVGVLGAAGAFTTIRWIGKRAHPLISVNYFSLLCVVISTLSLLLAQPLHLSSTLSFKLPASLRQWSMLIFLGICGFVMQFLLTKGLAVNGRGGGAKATHFIYTNMLFALALDKVVFGVSPGAWSLAGSGLILGSAVFVAVRKGKEEVPRIEESEEGEARHGAVGEHGTEEEEMGILRGRDVERSGVDEDDEVDNRGRESVLVDVERGELVGLRDMTPRSE